MIFLTQLTNALEDLTGRVARDERGQTAAEYLGIIVVIAVIIGALATTEIGDTLRGHITATIGQIFGGGR